ncbi:DUF1353 domain-containing protein [Methylobacterium sp. J-077]|uniref:DUF1353 domain-containing protein n=1 Tax=Methylobacterium sp. J-077 TaxID=2836656 RepID=UPI001FB8C5DC|nr:DUF1353 domain-containing protein [Methylobacterium sp. J-077]MCJ2121802.1 DUF1353 domain-containing protein [Methylobacterium sp. J-077]
MIEQITRRHALVMVGSYMAVNAPALSDEMSEKKAFMQAALASGSQKTRTPGEKIPQKFEFIPVVRPFVDWDYYYLTGELEWSPNAGQQFKPVLVESGFVTDLASVPRPLWSIFPPTGRYAYAAIVHDYLYWEQDRSKSEADDVLAAAMQDAKVNSGTITEFNLALKVAGSKAWNDNAASKAKGEKRILAKFPDNPLISWEEWRKQPGVFK